MPTSGPAYLAFDLGASSGRAILGRLEGRRLHMEEVHRFPTPIREDGERLFWRLDALWHEINVGLEKALAAAPGLRSLSIDSWGVDYVPLDRNGEPLRDAYCYRDPRVVGRMAQAFRQVPPEEIYAATGIQFMEINTLYQVLADGEQEPDRFARTVNRLTIADFFHFRLCGRPAVEVSLASTTQLMDPRSRSWLADLMDRFGIPSSTWPEIVPSGTRLGQAKGQPGIDVVAGCSHDTACAVAAVPAEEGSGPWAYLSCGTWSLLGVERSEPLLTEAARLAGFTNEAGYGDTIRLLKNLNGLWVLQECEREWREDGWPYTYDELLAEAEAADPSSRLIDLNDARFGLRGDMQQKLRDYCRERGMQAPESRGAVVRLLLDSMADGHRRALHSLEDLLEQRMKTLYIVGGGSRNDLLCRLTAEACGCRVVVGPAEATVLGNLLIQAKTMGDLPAGLSIREVVRASSTLRTFESSVTSLGMRNRQNRPTMSS